MGSINQTGTGIRLPNFCNLGVMLRSLVVANVFVLAFAIVRAATWEAFSAELVGMAAFAEPILITTLAMLCFSRPALKRMPYGAALLAVALFELLLAWTIFQLGASISLEPRTASFPQVALLSLFVTGCVVAYFELRARALEPAVAEARIQALQARIRPHFLYNSINAVLSLIRSEPRRAERALEDLADLFRVLMAENRTLAPLASEIGLVRQYLALESLRLGERLRVAWRTEGMPGDALVPPLVLQPLVENAVYHGIEPCPEGGEIGIEVGLAGGQLQMVLTNPYPRESRQTAGNRMAIANIRERLQLHFDAEAAMRSEVTDGIYKVTIRMPYLTSKSPAA
ncbi:MAG TPA: histidine kinase [Usitatibacter sp.]|nr:histidine kinase [Usitatibacter sp.]